MRDNVQGIATLVGRRLGKTLTIKHKVWDLAMFTIDRQDKIRRQGPVVRKVDNVIHRINHYPADSVVCFVNTYPLDSDLSGG